MGLGYHDGVKATITPDASVSYQIADTAVKTPVLVITNDKWGCPAVVFDGQCMADLFSNLDCAGIVVFDEHEQCMFNLYPGLDYAGIYDDKFVELEQQFWTENTAVKQFWSNLGILETAHGDFYSYDERVGCKFVCDALSADIIDWNAEPEAEDEGVRSVIADAFCEITDGRFEFPSDANLGNGQTDSVRKIVEEALTVADRRAERGAR